MKKQTVAIIGFGRFGKTLCKLLQDDCLIRILTKHPEKIVKAELSENCIVSPSAQNAFECEVIFFCVPIRDFETILLSHKDLLKNQLVIDVLSVKLHAKKVFEKVLKGTGARAMLTHPMFGPDSSKNGFSGLRIVANKFTAKHGEFLFWKRFFEAKGLKVIEMSPEEHDRLAAQSQGVAHLFGRMLAQANITQTIIDTKGAQMLQELKQQTCNDSWELFEDLQNFNPFTSEMRTAIFDSLKKIDKKLISSYQNYTKDMGG